MQFQATVHSEIVVRRTAYELEADRSLPPSSCAIADGTACEDVDATCYRVVFVTEEIVLVGNERDDWERQKALGDVGGIGLVACYLGVHLVVSDGSSRDLAVLAPVLGVARGSVSLEQEAIGEDVGGRCDIAPDSVSNEHSRANNGRSADIERAIVELTFLPWVAAVVGIIDDGILYGRCNRENKPLIIDAVGHAEHWCFCMKHPKSQQACEQTQ